MPQLRRLIISFNELTRLDDLCNLVSVLLIRSNDNDSTGFWPPGSLHTLGADPGVQMGTFNIEIGFLCGLKCFALKNSYNRVYI